jgi:predicted Zn-dependent peptidase
MNPALRPPLLSTLPNGLRIVALPMPWRQTVSLSVYLRTGSLHEPARLAGISHVVEHMAFKGTASRDCQRINLDAERLGAELNAHTDKDHTAFHIDGLAADLPAFVELLADLIQNPSFPEDELARERQVILQELAEVEEDPAALAFQAFDRAGYGASHAAGRPVIGLRRAIERISRQDLVDYVGQRYGAGHVVVAAAGPFDPAVLLRSVERHFGGMARGQAPQMAPAPWQGGWRATRLGGSAQCQLVLGFEAPTLADEAHAADVVAAALLGEGMSSPLLDEVRERRGLAYYVSCSADILPLTAQFVVEGATAPRQAGEFLEAVTGLLRRHADAPAAPADLARARTQLRLRALRGLEQPGRRLEAAAQDLFTFGRLRAADDSLQRLEAVSAAEVQAVFQRLLAGRAALGLAGSVPARLREQAQALLPL